MPGTSPSCVCFLAGSHSGQASPLSRSLSLSRVPALSPRPRCRRIHSLLCMFASLTTSHPCDTGNKDSGDWSFLQTNVHASCDRMLTSIIRFFPSTADFLSNFLCPARPKAKLPFHLPSLGFHCNLSRRCQCFPIFKVKRRMSYSYKAFSPRWVSV